MPQSKSVFNQLNPLVFSRPCASSSSKHDSIRESSDNFLYSTFSTYWITTLFTYAQKRDPSSLRRPRRLAIKSRSFPASTDYILSPYDAHHYSLHPRSRFPSISAKLFEMRKL